MKCFVWGWEMDETGSESCSVWQALVLPHITQLPAHIYLVRDSISSIFRRKHLSCTIVIVCSREPLCSYGNKTGTSIPAVSIQLVYGCQDTCTYENSTERIQHVHRWRLLAGFGEEKPMNCVLLISLSGIFTVSSLAAGEPRVFWNSA